MYRSAIPMSCFDSDVPSITFASGRAYSERRRPFIMLRSGCFVNEHAILEETFVLQSFRKTDAPPE